MDSQYLARFFGRSVFTVNNDWLLATSNDFLVNDYLGDVLFTWDVVHDVEHRCLENRSQPTCTGLALAPQGLGGYERVGRPLEGSPHGFAAEIAPAALDTSICFLQL